MARSGPQHEVAVAALPRGHRIAGDRLHLDIDAEQVVAALGAVLGDLREEVAGGQPLALQAALHVGERQQHRVDLAAIDLRAKLLEVHLLTPGRAMVMKV